MSNIIYSIIFLAIAFIYLFPIAKILRKAGFSGWWCLIVAVPFVNLIMLYIFAFVDWPSQRRVGQAN